MKPSGPFPAQLHGPEPASSSTSVALPPMPKTPGRSAGESGCMAPPFCASRLRTPFARGRALPS